MVKLFEVFLCVCVLFVKIFYLFQSRFSVLLAFNMGCPKMLFHNVLARDKSEKFVTSLRFSLIFS